MRFVIYLILYFLPIFLASCGSSTGPGIPLNLEGRFSAVPLSDGEVYTLQRHNGRLFVATDQGLQLFDFIGEPQPKAVFFDTASVQSILVLDNDFWLAGVYFAENSGDNLFKSTDQGQSWQPFRNGYGGERQLTPTTMDGYIVGGDTVIFARTSGFGNVGRSLDGGRSWESVRQTWENPTLETNHFVRVNPDRPDKIWTGGATALFVPILFTSKNSGNDWEGFIPIENVETTVYDVAIHHKKSNQVMAGLGIGIRRSTDNGKSWATAYNETAVFSLTHSASKTGVIYASGVNSQGTLFFAASGDFGSSWETVEMENSPTGIQVNDMVSVLQDEQEVLYLGTNKGVYSFTFEE